MGWTGTRVGATAAAAALAAAAGVGPYFSLRTPEPADGWRPVSDLHLDAGGALDGVVDTFARLLGTSERRVAASIFFQGYAARLWSPLVGCHALGLPVPDLAAYRLGWRSGPSEPFTLAAVEPDGWASRVADGLPDAAVNVVLEGHLRPMVAVLGGLTRVAEPLLWGNAASALVGSAVVLDADRPDARAGVDLRGVVAALLAVGPLRGTGTLADEDPPALAFRRRSCCLYYRVPGGGMCGDCSLLRPSV